jgi:hypothetical protein
LHRSDDLRDDYDDLPPDPRPRPRSNPAVAVILILAGVLVLLLAVCGGAVALFWMRAAPVAPPAAAVSAVDEGPGRPRRILDRNDAKALILDKSPEHVREQLGAPARVTAGAREEWHFISLTRDPQTGLVDQESIVAFENGRVVEVRFVPAAIRK